MTQEEALLLHIKLNQPAWPWQLPLRGRGIGLNALTVPLPFSHSPAPLYSHTPGSVPCSGATQWLDGSGELGLCCGGSAAQSRRGEERSKKQGVESASSCGQSPQK
mmetsp:Transcript_27414/g.74156  ORF Transcript_27414/g.74156 Transcript_27414/m.74156 type:complete len:106 (-) Transcript_27414:1749-2066(-)